MIALLITNQTERVISKLETDPTTYYLRESINFRGDTFLHYACAKNNKRLIEYIMKKNPQLSNIRNNIDQKPEDLLTDATLKPLYFGTQNLARSTHAWYPF